MAISRTVLLTLAGDWMAKVFKPIRNAYYLELKLWEQASPLAQELPYILGSMIVVERALRCGIKGVA